MNIKASIIGLIASTLLSSPMIANAAPSVKTAAKPAVHSTKSAHPKMVHSKASTRAVRKDKTTGQTKTRHSVKARHSIKKAR